MNLAFFLSKGRKTGKMKRSNVINRQNHPENNQNPPERFVIIIRNVVCFYLLKKKTAALRCRFLYYYWVLV